MMMMMIHFRSSGKFATWSTMVFIGSFNTRINAVIINKIQDDKKFDTPACFFNEKDNPK